jgi:hypothetical protein
MNQLSQSVKYKPLNGYVLNILLIWPSFFRTVILQKMTMFYNQCKEEEFCIQR